MKKTNLYIASSLVVLGLAACNGTQTSTTSTDSTSTTGQMSPGDSAVTTTTTTTTTHHRYAGTFMPQPDAKYMDLRTHKQVSVRIDTEKGQIVNSETNEPINLLVMPTTHDTIYGMTGNVVNNDIMQSSSGDYMVDTTKLSSPASSDASMSTPTSTTATDAATPDGNYKEKDKKNKSKIKTPDYKIKDKNGDVKVKDR
jgi:hypothetical protein